MAYSFEPSVANTVYVPDQLIAGDYKTITDTVTVASGQVLVRGALLGQITAGGQFILATSGAADGSQLPSGWVILAEDTNTSASGTNAATSAPVYLSGEFDAAQMTFGTGITAASAKLSLHSAGSSLFLKLGALSNAIV